MKNFSSEFLTLHIKACLGVGLSLRISAPGYIHHSSLLGGRLTNWKTICIFYFDDRL
jgi:hypothetical protein